METLRSKSRALRQGDGPKIGVKKDSCWYIAVAEAIVALAYEMLKSDLSNRSSKESPQIRNGHSKRDPDFARLGSICYSPGGMILANEYRGGGTAHWIFNRQSQTC